jgi:hypothetical protein
MSVDGVTHQTTLRLSFKIKCCAGQLRPPLLADIVAASYARCRETDVGVAPDLRRLLRNDCVYSVVPGHRALAAQSSVAGIGRLLQEPERFRLHLPAVTWQMVKAGGCHGSH